MLLKSVDNGIHTVKYGQTNKLQIKYVNKLYYIQLLS